MIPGGIFPRMHQVAELILKGIPVGIQYIDFPLRQRSRQFPVDRQYALRQAMGGVDHLPGLADDIIDIFRRPRAEIIPAPEKLRQLSFPKSMNALLPRYL